MRELIVTIILLSGVSSEEFEPKKRLGLPSDDDPNFWPTRGRRSYWSNPRLSANLIHRDLPKGPEIDYTGCGGSWSNENDLNWRINICQGKQPVSLVLPLQEYHSADENDFSECGERCIGQIRGRGRRGDERWRRQQPLYAEEPGWIAINYDNRILGSSGGSEDPFIVARGKKRDAEIFDVRERRQLEDVLRSYDTDPFFVARGKRGDFGSFEETESQSFRVNDNNEFPSKPRNRRSIETGYYKKASKFEQSELLKSKNFQDSNLFPVNDNNNNKDGKVLRNDKNDKKLFLTSQLLQGMQKNNERELKNRHTRLQRSSLPTEIFETDENNNKWMKRSDVPHVSDDISVVKSRYSHPRDKHSNLQRILDEPFFVSRGKKKRGDDDDIGEGYNLRYEKKPEDEEEGEEEDKEFPTKVSREFDLRRVEILKNLLTDDVGPSKISKDRQLLLEKMMKNGFKRFKTDNIIPYRNRRGMLDEILNSDDPFYVARGKRVYYTNPKPQMKYFDVTINEGNGNADDDDDDDGGDHFAETSSSTSRNKLLEKLSNFAKIRTDHLPIDYKRNNDFWNLTNNAIH